MPIYAHFLIAAPASNSGKTTLTLGMLRALANRGHRVQPFKCGPDYIDTLHHTTAARNQSINLDTFMASEQHVANLYAHYCSQADIAVTEGVMGLFDGMDKMKASSAAMAELLDIPVVLVVNAKAMAYSVAPLLYGFKNFYTGIKVVGTIFNFVNSESHYRFLQEACADVGVEALGYLPQNPKVVIPSRHLGLHISSEINYEAIIQTLAEAIPETINLDRLLEITRIPNLVERSFSKLTSRAMATPKLKVAIARDAAFSFTYPQNIAILAELGTVTYFSPLVDAELPETDFLYLPGGYPELYVETLAANQSMRESIARYCNQGGLTYAECGGFMYLGQSIADGQGQSFPMVGVLTCKTSMEKAKMTLGYRIMHWEDLVIKGHEFHYSHLEELTPQASLATITNAKGAEVSTKFYRQYNTFASYIHLYWGDNPAFILRLLQAAKMSDSSR